MTEMIILETTSCCNCGVSFAAPKSLIDARRSDGKTIYCPNGHNLSWGETEADRLRKQLQEAQRNWSASVTREREEREHRLAAEAERERLKSRIKRGVCPCCKRSFINVKRHICAKHPKFAEENA